MINKNQKTRQFKSIFSMFAVLALAVFGFTFFSNSALAAWTINANNVIVSYVAIPNTSTSAINVSGNWTTSAAFTAGSNNTVTFNDTGAQTITGATTWNNLIINNTSDPANDTSDVDPAAVQTVAGTLTVTDGQWSSFTGDDYVDVSIGANGIIKPDAGITVSGEWDNSGTFTHNSGTVTFDGAGGSTQYILGNTTFNNFTANVGASARTLLFDVNDTQTVSGTWTIAGEAGKLITLGVSPACGSVTSVTFNYKGSSVTYGTVSVSGQCFMDRNLGASQVATAYNDTDSYGDYFQWGRLDDLHQNSGSGTTTDLSSGSDPLHGNFIYGMNDPWDWVSPQIDTLWQSASYVNNPCPSGWHVPLSSEWSTAMTALGLTSCSSDCLNSMANSSLKLPAAGYRRYSDAALANQDTYGYVWSSSPYSTNAYYLFFNSTGVNPANDYIRANGYSARCLKN